MDNDSFGYYERSYRINIVDWRTTSPQDQSKIQNKVDTSALD